MPARTPGPSITRGDRSPTYDEMDLRGLRKPAAHVGVEGRSKIDKQQQLIKAMRDS
jgi:hypothetical protein